MHMDGWMDRMHIRPGYRRNDTKQRYGVNSSAEWVGLINPAACYEVSNQQYIYLFCSCK